jgi:hypothetical protein
MQRSASPKKKKIREEQQLTRKDMLRGHVWSSLTWTFGDDEEDHDSSENDSPALKK